MSNSDLNPLLKVKVRPFGYYEIIIFSFLLFESIFMMPDSVVDEIAKASYLITYKFGFISKALIGSFFSLFTDRITSYQIYVTAIITFLILIFLIAFLLGAIIRKSQPNTRSSVIVFVMLFLSSPFSVTYLLGMYIGRFDTYWIIITLASLVFLKRPFLRWVIPLLCCVAMLIHQGYVFTYMPALAIPMLYEIYKNKYSKKHIIIFLLSCFSLITLFLIFQVSPGKIPFISANDFSDYLSRYSDFKVSTVMLYNVYFASFKESYYGYIRPLLASYALPAGVAVLTFSLPLMIVFGVVWKKCFYYTENRFLKLVYLVCAFSPLIIIPVACFLNDWDRYWASIINTQFILIFYLLYSNEQAVVDSVEKIGDFFERHFLLLIVIIIFACSIKFSEAGTNIFSFIKDKNAISKILEDFVNSNVNSF